MRRTLVAVTSVLALFPAGLAAQLVWEVPSLVSPYAPSGFSAFLLDAAPGGDLGAMAHWRRAGGSVATGYRVGVASDASDDLAVFGGVDISGVLADAVEDAPIEVLWWSGLGGGIGDEILVSIPLGIVAGWRGSGDGRGFAPYAGAHIALDLASGGGDALDLSGVADVGLDLTLTSGWVVRVGASIGSRGRDALAIGMRLPT